MKTILSLSDVICSKIRNEPVENGSCDGFVYAKIMSRNLVVTAASSIFSNEFQCILEPVVNSIDAYNSLDEKSTNKNVGKFGLGFFSLFTILLKNPNNMMKLTSYHASGSWTATIKQKCISCPGEDVYDFSVEITDLEDNLDESGLKIDIYADVGVDIDNYIVELLKLKYTTSSSITANIFNTKNYINNGDLNNRIDVVLQSKYIGIDDYATGISKDTLINTLLIPSISSKGIKSNVVYTPRIGRLTSIESTLEYNNLYILVGDIIVYTDKAINMKNLIVYGDEIEDEEEEEEEEDNQERYIFLIQLNSSTPIPSSRDDIQLDNELVQNEFLINVEHLFTLCMENSGKYATLKRIIRKYAERHPFISSHIENIIDNTIVNYLNNGFYIVPDIYLPMYEKITENCIPDEDTLHPLIESHLLQNFRFEDSIINNKNIFVFKGENLPVSDYAYSSSILFLRRDFIMKKNWKDELLILFPQLSLNVNVDVPKFIKKDLRSQYINNYKKILGMSTWYDIGDLPKMYVYFLNIMFTYMNVSTEFYKKLFYLYDKLFDQLRPSAYTYGFSQPTLRPSINIRSMTSYYNLMNENISKHGLKISGMFLDILKDHVDHVLKEKTTYVPTYILPYTYFILPSYGYDYIKSKYELVFLSVVYTLINVDDNLESFLFLRNLWIRTFGTKSNYDLLIKYVTSYILFDDVLKVTIIDPVKKSYEIYRQQFGVSSIVNRDIYEYDVSFSIKNLIKKVYTYNNFNFYDINDYVDIDDVYGGVSDNLQILDILINDTAVDYLHNIISVMTMSTSYLTIDISRNTDSIYCSIANMYTTTEDKLISMFIPYFKLDNRYFYIYKHAERINYITYSGDCTFKWEDVPVVRGGRVVDINRSLYIEKRNYDTRGARKDKSITKFEVTFKSTGDKNIEDYVKLLSYIKDEVNILKNVVLNGENMPEVKHLSMVINNKYGTGYIIPFNYKSIVTLGGEVLNDLETFKLLIHGEVTDFGDMKWYKKLYGEDYDSSMLQIRPYFLTGVHFDLNRNVIKRMQGNKYTLNTKNVISIKDIEYSINDTGLYSLYLKQLQHPYLNIVDDYLSPAPVEQILPSKSGKSDINLSTFVLYYRSYNPPFPLPLAEIMHILASDKIVEENTHYLTLQVAYRWLSTKNKNIVNEEEDVDVDINTGNVTKRKYKVSNKTKIFTYAFVQSFWEVGRSLDVYNKYFVKDTPLVSFELMDANVRGSYHITDNIIKINTKYMKNHDFQFDKGSIIKYVLDSDYFGKKFPSTTVIHELSHAWRSENEGAHDGIMLYDNMTKKEEFRDFNDAANYMYDRVIENNFFEVLTSKLNTV